METSTVRKQVKTAIDHSRKAALSRRDQVAAAQAAYATFVDTVATPLVKQVAAALKAEGIPFTVATPAGGLRLTADGSRGDVVEFALDTDAAPPQVTLRSTRGRGSRTIEAETPVKAGTAVADLTEDDLLSALLAVLDPWMQR